MLIRPELIVYLWLLPAFIFLFFPVLCLSLLMLGKKLLVSRAQAGGKMASVYQSLEYPVGNDKREHSRERIEGMIAHVTDGIRCCRGSITDFSQYGVCLVSPKGRLNQNADRLGVLLTGTGQSYHMQVKPRWIKDRGEEIRIGASIEEVLGSWNSFAGEGVNSQLVNAA